MTDAILDPPIRLPMQENGGRQTVVASAAVLFCLVALGVMFPRAALGAFRVWMESPTFNHCFLILPLSLFMIWQRRGALAAMAPASDLRVAMVMPVLAIVWLATRSAGVLEAEQFAVLSMVQLMLAGLLGLSFYRALAAPFLYLYFLVPSGAFLIPVLQAFTARFAVLGLHLLGVPVFSNGAVIEIPAGTFVVAEACAGLRFLVAAIAFGVFFAIQTYRSPARRIAFIGLSCVVPIVANGFRALGLIVAAEWIGSAESALADHILYGWIFFSAVLLILILIGNFFSDRRESGPVPERPVLPTVVPHAYFRAIMAAVLCLAGAAMGPAVASRLETEKPTTLPDAGPPVSSPWREVGVSHEWHPRRINPSRSFAQTFVEGSDRIDRYVGLYGLRFGSSLVRSDNRDAGDARWSFESERSGLLSFRGHAIRVHITTWLNGPQKRIVWSYYVIGGLEVSSLWLVKWSELRAYLTGGRCASAYVAISMDLSDESAGTRTAERLLAATEPLSSYLCSSTRSRERR